jgi:hypothetical protein
LFKIFAVISGKSKYRAVARPGISKYGEMNSRGVADGQQLSESEKGQLNKLVSLGLSKSTWSNYNTAEKMLRLCCEEKGILLQLPLAEPVIVKFVLWLAECRGVSSGTIAVYLSGLRNMHAVRGIAVPTIRTPQVELIIKGLANKQATQKRLLGEESRKPITPELLRLLKARISESDAKIVDKRLLWAVCSIMYFGAFRGNELLCKGVGEYDPAFELCSQDIHLVSGKGGEESLQIKVKAPKEDKLGKSTMVDIFPSVPDLCPVRAFKRWRESVRSWEVNQPAFRWDSGHPLTCARLNSVLRERLEGFVDGEEKLYSTHSFRIGAASMMGSLGFEDEEIKALGRWSSRAFEGYLKLPRAKRRAVAVQFSKAMGW